MLRRCRPADLIFGGERPGEVGAPRTSATRYPCANRRARASAQPASRRPPPVATGALADTFIAGDPTRVRPVHTTGVTRCCAASERRAMPWDMGAVVGWEIIDPLYYGRYGYPHASWAWLRRHRPSPGSSPRACCPSGRSPATRIRRHPARPRRFVIAPGSGSSPRSGAQRRPGRSATCSTGPTRAGRYRKPAEPAVHAEGARSASGRRSAGSSTRRSRAWPIAPRWTSSRRSAAHSSPRVIAEMARHPARGLAARVHLSTPSSGAADPEYQQGATLAENGRAGAAGVPRVLPAALRRSAA